MEAVDFLFIHFSRLLFPVQLVQIFDATNIRHMTLALLHLQFFVSLFSFNSPAFTRLSSLLFMESSEVEQRDGWREDGKINNNWLQTHVHHIWKWFSLF